MITIVDYGVGNIGSIENMLKYLNIEFLTSSNPNQIINAHKLILPGVGAYDTAINKLQKAKFFDIIKKKVKEDKTPVLGICLGMQLLLDSSEEGKEAGFGFIEGKAIKFDENKLVIPHMGWNFVKINDKYDNEEDLRFYFVHSYFAKVQNNEDVWMTTDYEGEFVSAIRKDHVFGVQFHPEKSHKFGMKILNEFNKYK